MATSLSLLNKRRFMPLFITQLLGAFNDNLFKNAMVLFVVYGIYNDEATETLFSAVATAVFILPFFLMSALAGQLADTRDQISSTPGIEPLSRMLFAVALSMNASCWRATRKSSREGA